MIEKNTIIQGDCILTMRELVCNSIDIIFTDPPYGLGSEVIIRPDGKPDYSKASDFMSKWDMPTGDYWEKWFVEALRVLKYGGHCLMFGMDRQLLLFKYYAHLAGFSEKQSLYWFFISNFPKASNLSINIDKKSCRDGLETTLGREPTVEEFKTVWGSFREVVGVDETAQRPNAKISRSRDGAVGEYAMMGDAGKITSSTTEFAKKYDGYKYSVAPLKQTNETIMVFQKPYKTGSCLHDVLAMEGGDKDITCGALDIDGGRVGIADDDKGKNNYHMNRKTVKEYDLKNEITYDSGIKKVCTSEHTDGRYPSQTFIECICDKVEIEPTTVTEPTEVKGGIWQKSQGKPAGRTYRGGNQTHTNPNCPCAVLDRQSGESKSKASGYNWDRGKDAMIPAGCAGGTIKSGVHFEDTGGCSKVLHHCKFEEGDFDLYYYCPKVGKKERDTGMEGAEDKVLARSGGAQVAEKKGETEYLQNHIGLNKITVVKNNHPTLKPIALIQRLLELFKTPNRQVVLDPFIGSGTTAIVCKRLDMDYIGVEINPDYVEIARKRIDSSLSQPESHPESQPDLQLKMFE